MDSYQLILENLQEENPTRISVVPPFYFDEDTPVQKIRTLNRQIRRAKSL